VVPQAPQLASELARSTQAPPQLTRLGAHTRPQIPALQTDPAAQLLPQAPQFMGSLRWSTQVVPQGLVPVGQEQTPPLHCLPPLQAVPQAPQWALLVPRSTQAPEQASRPAAQVAAQRPELHTSPTAH
jgi:hypothetical protein